MVNYFQYGTDESVEIWLLRYGFSMEDIQKIKKYVLSVDENKIVFNENVDELEDGYMKEQVERYR